MYNFLTNLFETVGTLLVAFAALRVHHRVLREEKIDRHTFREMKRERIAGIIGVVCIILSFLMKTILIVWGG